MSERSGRWCLVVGGAGFVGSHVVDRLLAEGHTVDVVDDLSTGSLSNLATARAEHVGALKFHNVDVRQPELADLLGRLRPEVAVHLALPSSGPAARVLSTALGGQRTCSTPPWPPGRPRWSSASTPSPTTAPCPSGLPIKEGTLGSPVSSATIAQRSVADLLALYRERHSLEYTALALAGVYGTRQRANGGVVAAFVAARQAGRPAEIHGTGRQTRTSSPSTTPSTPSSGRRRRVSSSMSAPACRRRSPRCISRCWVCRWRRRCGSRRAGEVERFALSPVRARIHLAWAPWTDLATGIGQLLAELAASAPPTPPGRPPSAQAGSLRTVSPARTVPPSTTRALIPRRWSSRPIGELTNRSASTPKRDENFWQPVCG